MELGRMVGQTRECVCARGVWKKGVEGERESVCESKRQTDR